MWSEDSCQSVLWGKGETTKCLITHVTKGEAYLIIGWNTPTIQEKILKSETRPYFDVIMDWIRVHGNRMSGTKWEFRVKTVLPFCLFLFCFVSWPLLLFFFFSFFDIIDIVKVPFLGQKCRLSFKLWKVHNRYYPKQNYYSKIISVYKVPQIPRCINTDYPSAVVFEKFAPFYCDFISPLLSCCHQLQSEDLTQ